MPGPFFSGFWGGFWGLEAVFGGPGGGFHPGFSVAGLLETEAKTPRNDQKNTPFCVVYLLERAEKRPQKPPKTASEGLFTIKYTQTPGGVPAKTRFFGGSNSVFQLIALKKNEERFGFLKKRVLSAIN